MSALRIVSSSALVLALAACTPAEDQPSPPTEVSADADAPAPASEPGGEEGETLDPLVIAARNACAEGDLGFVSEIPEGSGFVSRGPDARVHVAWRLDGEDAEYLIRTPELAEADRLPFDFAVADFMRHNMVTGFDRTGITGAFRFRDGRFCVVQTERAVIDALQDATLTAAATL